MRMMNLNLKIHKIIIKNYLNNQFLKKLIKSRDKH